ncbi:hypothetical protein Pmani_008694 [Petrolisthes manimaculis]|uniref:Uncharacterized protein n=1 Tax=Petrolisthes manimaculis TaxID=1843537 RepID=A0AAE1Q5T3_9EUCA|nr:hypothetical protein Pmani_008694 [Petrolisthes manimaculis]
MTSNSIHGHESEGAFFHHPDLPYFDYHESGNVTARLGTTAVLNCRVKSIGNKTCYKSWNYHACVPEVAEYNTLRSTAVQLRWFPRP